MVPTGDTPLVYLPGIDGSPGAGDMVLEALRGPRSFQFLYPVGGPQNLDALASMLICELDRRGFERAILIGESFGGALAQTVALHHPARVAGLMLIASFVRNPAPMLARVVGPALRHWPSSMLKWPMRLVADAVLAGNLSREQKSKFLDAALAMPLADMGARIRSLEHFSVEDRANWQQPTIWVWGDNEKLVNVRWHLRWLGRIRPSDRVVILDGAGHLIPRARLELLADAIRDFIAGIESKNRS